MDFLSSMQCLTMSAVELSIDLRRDCSSVIWFWRARIWTYPPCMIADCGGVEVGGYDYDRDGDC
jgi:hypothetical protein